jgi:hypothetical protein
MSDEELDTLLRETLQQALGARYLVVALVQLLVERKVLKGKEDDILSTLEAWAEGLQKEDFIELRIAERVRTMREAWSKLPKQ